MAVLASIEKKFGTQVEKIEQRESEKKIPIHPSPGQQGKKQGMEIPSGEKLSGEKTNGEKKSHRITRSTAKFSEADFVSEIDRFWRRLNLIHSRARTANTVSGNQTLPERSADAESLPLRPRGPTPATAIAANVRGSDHPRIPQEFWESFDPLERKVWDLRSRGEFLLMRTEIQRVEDWVERWMGEWRPVPEEPPTPNVEPCESSAGVVSADEIDLGI